MVVVVMRRTPDHPRSRGVYPPGTPRTTPRRGSSPLARGLRSGRACPTRRCGIIPARAGFTAGGVGPDALRQDHPRSRGVYRGAQGRGGPVAGSSPLARGLHIKTVDGDFVTRIIPARAGFTHGPDPRSGRHRDHPRSRGVYSGDWTVTTPGGGSSPLARGLPGEGDERISRRGIIPARAGFTW